MAAPASYLRNAALYLITPVAGSYFQGNANAIIIKDPQRIQFKIEKNLGKEPNKAEITITNLAPTTRSQIEKQPLLVILQVGYAGQLTQIFTGDLRKGFTTRDGTDWSTKLLLGDGSRGFQYATISKSYGQGTQVKQVLDDITGAIGLKLPPGIANAVEFSTQYAGGYVAHGTCEQELTHVLTPLGMSWSFQDGQLQVLREGAATTNSAIVVSQDTGMIGSPEFGDPTKPGQPPILKVATECDPRIRCGCLIQLQAINIKGLFRVDKLTHVGDTRGKDWKTDIEARPAT